MNRFLHILIPALCLSAATLVTSCIYEDEVPCPAEVRFVYDLNMEFADAFPTQVEDVTLFIFDADGRFVTLQRQQEQPGEGYRMALNINPGTYQLLAWAGTAEGNECYSVSPQPTPGVTTLQEVQMALQHEGDTHSAALPDLWHGLLTDFTVAADQSSLATIRLTKNTNRFRIVLQSQGKDMHADDYTLAITAANHCTDYQNLPVEGCTPLAYQPYTLQEANIANEGSGASYTAIAAEMATLRLMADQEQRFTVTRRNATTRADGTGEKKLIDIDLIRFLELMRLDEHADMPLQEFLDRESTWNIILLTGSDGTLLTIQINAWTMVFNNTEL